MKKTKSLFIAMLAFAVVAGINLENTHCMTPYETCYNQEGSDNYIYGFEYDLADGSVTEQQVFEAIAYQGYLTPTGLDTFLKRGNIPSYIDDLIAAGRLPQGYTVEGGTTPTPNPTPSISIPNTPTVQEPVNTTPTLNESKAGTYVVIETDAKSYETYNKENEIRTWNLAEHVDVKGLMSNGYYKVVFEEKEQYISKNFLVTLEKYEAAWEETERVESKCETAGSITFTNAITGETKTESMDALEHNFEQSKEILPTCTETGSKTYTCVLCGKETEEKITATGHAAGDTIETQKETFLFTNATETRCMVCDEVVETTDMEAKLDSFAIVFATVASIVAFAIIVLKKLNKAKRNK